MRRYGVAEVRSDKRTLDDLAEAVSDIDVSDLQLVDGPAVGCADPALCFALGLDGAGHVGT